MVRRETVPRHPSHLVPRKPRHPRGGAFHLGDFTKELSALNCIDNLSDGENRSASSNRARVAGLSACPAR